MVCDARDQVIKSTVTSSSPSLGLVTLGQLAPVLWRKAHMARNWHFTPAVVWVNHHEVVRQSPWSLQMTAALADILTTTVWEVLDQEYLVKMFPNSSPSSGAICDDNTHVIYFKLLSFGVTYYTASNELGGKPQEVGFLFRVLFSFFFFFFTGNQGKNAFQGSSDESYSMLLIYPIWWDLGIDHRI